MWWFIALCATLCFLVGLYFRKIYSFWENQGVSTPPWHYFVGNMLDSVLLKRSLAQIYCDIYNDFPGYNYVGYYKFMNPGVVVRNPEVIKDILLKDFKYFHDNDFDIDENNDMIFGNNPFTLKGEKWKVVRQQMVTSLTTGKVKSMSNLLLENCNKMVKFLQTTPEASNGIGLEVKELASRYTSENVASCAFGLDGQGFTSPNGQFWDIGKKLTEPTFWSGVKMMMVFMMPALSSILKVRFFTKEITHFLQSIVRETLKFRQSKGVVRNDFLDVMNNLKLKINDEKEFNDDDITAHAGGFFLDGYETSAIVISYALYEIARQPDVQNRLRKEIHEAMQVHGGLTYEALQSMDYLDCVLKENLRKNVPLMALTRVCTDTCKLPPVMEDNTGPEVTIYAGMPVTIPVHAIHNDEAFFPEPETFNPERFSEVNRDNVIKYTYLPFGDGPRTCVGMKFGVLQTKYGLASVLANFELKVNSRTEEPLLIDPKAWMKAPIGGIWLDFTRINSC